MAIKFIGGNFVLMTVSSKFLCEFVWNSQLSQPPVLTNQYDTEMQIQNSNVLVDFNGWYVIVNYGTTFMDIFRQGVQYPDLIFASFTDVVSF